MAAVLCLAGAGAAVAAAVPAVTHSRAGAVAAAVELRRADLPGYTQSANPITAQQRQQSATVNTCDGGVAPSQAWALAQSPTFTLTQSGGSQVTVDSSTQVMPSTALVAKDLAAVTGSRGPRCLEASLESSLRGSLPKGSTVRSINGGPLPPVVSDSAGTFRDRFMVMIAVKQGSATTDVPIYADAIGFVYGQLEVSLTVESVIEQPSTPVEQRLAGILLARARTTLG